MAVSRHKRVLVLKRVVVVVVGCCCCCFNLSARMRSCSSLKLAKKIFEYDKYLVPQGDVAGVVKGVANSVASYSV